MSIVKYRALLKIIEQKSFTKAAVALGYTQSGISVMVNSLEKEFGFPLFIRYKNGVLPTENAESLIPYLKQIVTNDDIIQSIVGKINNADAGSIKIGGLFSILSTIMPEILAEYLQIHPDIKIELVEGSDYDLNEMLLNKKIDIAFTAAPTPEGFDFIPMMDDPIQLLVSKSHPLNHKNLVCLDDIRDYELLCPTKDYDNCLWNIFESLDTSKAKKIYLKSDSAILSMVESGLGITLMPELIAQNIKQEISVIDINEDINRVLGLAVPRKKDRNIAIQDFISATRKVFSGSNL